MKNGTLYAKKIKQAYNKFRGSRSSEPPEVRPPVEQLILGVLSQETSLDRAEKALSQILDDMVDYNELRVSTPAEVSSSISKHIPRSVQRAKTLLTVLNSVYQLEYTISLDHLAAKGVREVKTYLSELDGMTPYAMASVMLWSLGGHAIPVNDVALEFLKENDLVDENATGAEVQSFLERHVSSAEAKEFCMDLDAIVASKAFSFNGKAKSAKPAKSAKTSKKKTNSSKAGATKTTKKKSTTKKKTSAKTKTKNKKSPSK
ncbi:MAG TPA: hypothetical protein PKN33_11350 [Phycisphaerae bacterium]|nr:hypothetical protein [Phycisphaerales bacterium]HNO78646.1 hypothetical protein [Phycisphaerae bacterium]